MEVEVCDLPNTQPTEPSSQPWEDEVDNVDVWGKLYPIGYKLKPEDLTKPVYEIGRGLACDIRMTEQNVDPSILLMISKVQFRVHLETDNSGVHVFKLEDLSTNGTFVNKKKIGKNNKTVLRSNDEISISQPQNKAYLFVAAKTCNSWLPMSEINRYVILAHLGNGGYGEVKLAINKKTCQRYAIKKIIKNVCVNEKNWIANEIKILGKLDHAFIIKMEGVFEDENSVFILLEYMPGGDLRQKLRQVKMLSENETKFIFYQLLLAVQYLHRQGITHRDLKPENILLASDNGELRIKLTDFGLAKLMHAETALKTVCGTLLYTAPEIILSGGLKSYTPKVDVWSLGCILYLCLSGKTPFSPNNPMTIQEQIVRGYYERIKCNNSVSGQAIHLIEQMLINDPTKRITIDEALSHRWMQDKPLKAKVEQLLSSHTRENAENVTPEHEQPRKRARM